MVEFVKQSGYRKLKTQAGVLIDRRVPFTSYVNADLANTFILLSACVHSPRALKIKIHQLVASALSTNDIYEDRAIKIQHEIQECQPTFLAIDPNGMPPEKLVGKCRLMPITRPMALFFHSGPPVIDDLSRPLVRDSNI
jgi:hypothetical protein